MMDIEGARDRELLRREDDMRAVIASGSGRYADPWHPFDRTSPLLARVLEPAGFDVEIDDDVDHAMANLQGVDLVVVNAGDPWRSADSTGAAPRASTSGFAAALERGIGVLAVHSALSSLRDYPEWAPAIGGMWVPGLSWHPPADIADVTGGELPSGPTIEGFAVFDERYARLQQLGERQVVATHRRRRCRRTHRLGAAARRIEDRRRHSGSRRGVLRIRRPSRAPGATRRLAHLTPLIAGGPASAT